MGHLFLRNLPRTRKWRQVIDLLEADGDVPEIARASMEAVQTGLKNVPNDPGFRLTLTAIFDFVDSLQSSDPSKSLWERGFQLPVNPLILDYVASFKRKLDLDLSTQRSRSDPSEMAQNAFTETLVKSATASGSLFGLKPDEAQALLKRQLSGQSFKTLMHEFFTGFTRRYLQSYLTRAFPSYIGPNRRFGSMDSYNAFNDAFDLHIRQAIRITDEFVPGWYGKTRFEGRLTPDSVTRFAHIAFKKIRSEFARGATAGE
ncbi:MAG: hypothetical protein PHR28_08695 [candidate division Zixibacteria bacterium]|nr:hypothetical protein [candidate division Zixibacteria bacterium]